MTTTAVATAATIPAIAAATNAGAPRITAPTAASAMPTTIRASFTALKPFTNISTKLVTARIAPAMIEPIPAMEEPNSAKNPITFWIAPPIVPKIPATFGNSSSRTSISVPAPPLQRAKPSTTFPTTPMIPDTPPLNVFRTENSVLSGSMTLLATFKAAIEPAMTPIAYPIASRVPGSAPSITLNRSETTSTIPWMIALAVSMNPFRNPSISEDTPGSSSESPSQNPATKSFAAWMISGRFSCTASPILLSISPNDWPISSEWSASACRNSVNK